MGTISFSKDFKIKKIDAKFYSNSIKFNKLLESKEFTIIKQVNGKVELNFSINLFYNCKFFRFQKFVKFN